MTPYKLFLNFHGVLGLPIMTPYERQAYKKILSSLKSRGHLRIFEYGTGFSTLYFTRFLRAQGVDFKFYSVDNNPVWHRKISGKIEHAGLKDKVHLSVFAFDPYWAKSNWHRGKAHVPGQFAPRTKEEKAYIQRPLDLGGQFDIVVVDGRFRQHCLRVARQVLSPQGILILHDAHKEHYALPPDFLPYMQWVEGGKFCPWKKEKYRMLLGSKSPLPSL